MSDNSLNFHDSASDLLCGSNLLAFFGCAMQDVLIENVPLHAEHVSVQSPRQENLHPNDSNRAAHHNPPNRGDGPAAELALSNVGFRQLPGPELG